MELSKKQQEIVEATSTHTLVIAAAASGKTRLLTERVKWLLEHSADPTKIVMITFTNSAAEEMADRLGRPDGLFIGTIHGYANYLLLSRGIETYKVLDQEDFDKLFVMIKENPNCIKPVDHLIFDEAQDSTPEQFEFLLDMVNPKEWTICADYRQALYRWNGADPQYIIDLMERPGVTTYHLNENYRNGKDILGYARSLIQLAGYNYKDNSIAMREEKGRVIDLEYSSDGIANMIKRDGAYKDWFVLCRTNEQLDILMRTFDKHGIPYDTFKRADMSNKDLSTIMDKDSVKLLTIHASKGLEAPKVVVVGAKFYNLEEMCICYVAATRARDVLVWTRTPKKARAKYGKAKIQSWE